DDGDDCLRIMHAQSGRSDVKEVMTFTASGKVGINNSDPDFDLDVKGDIRSSNVLFVDKKAGNGSVAQFKAATAEAPYIGVYHHNLRSFYLQGDASVARLRADRASQISLEGGKVVSQENMELLKNLQVNGRVGINTSSPAQSLEVHGHIKGTRTLLIDTDEQHGEVLSVRAKSVEAPYISMYHGSRKRSFYLMAGEHAGENVVRFVADSADKFRFYSGGVEVHESLKVHKTTYFEGDIRVNGKTPFIFRRYDIAAAAHAHTSYLVADYEAAVVGFRALGGDIYENGSTNPIQVFMYKNGTKWSVATDFASHGSHERWEVDVMFVSRRLASRVGGTW
ncbi:MAG: hypothetical protein AAFO69_05155, partial [Bacteroidota bacterium]